MLDTLLKPSFQFSCELAEIHGIFMRDEQVGLGYTYKAENRDTVNALRKR